MNLGIPKVLTRASQARRTTATTKREVRLYIDELPL